MNLVPVKVGLSGHVFVVLEAMAKERGMGVGEFVSAHMERSVSRHLDRRDRGRPQARVNDNGAKHTRLTPDQVAELHTLSAQGWTRNELARRYGCSPVTIDNWRRRKRNDDGAANGRAAWHLTPDDIATIHRLSAEGWSITRIARYLGCGTTTVSRYRNQRGG